MKTMKKLVVCILALTMMLGLSVTALAEGNTGGQGYTDVSSVTIEKTYTAVGSSDTKSPEETFTFEIDRTGVTDAAGGLVLEDIPLPEVSAVTYMEGDAGKVGPMTKSIDVILPGIGEGEDCYHGVGVYTYTITEKQGTTVEGEVVPTAGVTYHSDPIKLVVTVLQTETGLVRQVGVHTEKEGEKTDKITNTYSAGTLRVTKDVKGLLGDKSRYFTFKVVFTAPTGKTVKSAISVDSSNSTNNSKLKTITFEEGNNTTEATFELKDEEEITFANIPYGVSYIVTETEEKDYTTTKSGDTGTIDEKLSEATAAFTNTKGIDGEVDTGVTLDSLPYILALLAVLGTAFFMTARKRHGLDD